MSKWEVVVNDEVTDEQVNELIEKFSAAKSRGITMIMNVAIDTFMICGFADTGWSKANAETMCEALNNSPPPAGFTIH